MSETKNTPRVTLLQHIKELERALTSATGTTLQLSGTTATPISQTHQDKSVTQLQKELELAIKECYLKDILESNLDFEKIITIARGEFGAVFCKAIIKDNILNLTSTEIQAIHIGPYHKIYLDALRQIQQALITIINITQDYYLKLKNLGISLSLVPGLDENNPKTFINLMQQLFPPLAKIDSTPNSLEFLGLLSLWKELSKNFLPDKIEENAKRLRFYQESKLSADLQERLINLETAAAKLAQAIQLKREISLTKVRPFSGLPTRRDRELSSTLDNLNKIATNNLTTWQKNFMSDINMFIQEHLNTEEMLIYILNILSSYFFKEDIQEVVFPALQIKSTNAFQEILLEIAAYYTKNDKSLLTTKKLLKAWLEKYEAPLLIQRITTSFQKWAPLEDLFNDKDPLLAKYKLLLDNFSEISKITLSQEYPPLTAETLNDKKKFNLYMLSLIETLNLEGFKKEYRGSIETLIQNLTHEFRIHSPELNIALELYRWQIIYMVCPKQKRLDENYQQSLSRIKDYEKIIIKEVINKPLTNVERISLLINYLTKIGETINTYGTFLNSFNRFPVEKKPLYSNILLQAISKCNDPKIKAIFTCIMRVAEARGFSSSDVQKLTKAHLDNRVFIHLEFYSKEALEAWIIPWAGKFEAEAEIEPLVYKALDLSPSPQLASRQQ